MTPASPIARHLALTALRRSRVMHRPPQIMEVGLVGLVIPAVVAGASWLASQVGSIALILVGSEIYSAIKGQGDDPEEPISASDRAYWQSELRAMEPLADQLIDEAGRRRIRTMSYGLQEALNQHLAQLLRGDLK